MNFFFCIFRKNETKKDSVTWDEQKAEHEHRERIRQRQEACRKKPIVWDDAAERKCQEKYRKKKVFSSNH